MQSDISKVHARHEPSFREKILGCFSKPVSCPKLMSSPFYLSCGQVPTLSLDALSQLLTRLQLSPVEQMVKMVRKI